MKKISIVVPVYYNYDNLEPLYYDIKTKLFDELKRMDYDYELVLVDDGSKDNSYDKILSLKSIDNKIKAVKLSRNFGMHSAILAGFSVCTGDLAVIKMADIQEPTELILDMLVEYNNGAEVVLAIRKDRKDSMISKLFSNTYYNIFRKFSGLDMPNGGFDTFLADRKVINVLVSLNEKNTTLMGLVLWSGFKTSKIYFNRLEREIGKSIWTLKKKVKLFEDSIYSFSIFPIKLIAGIGITFFIVSFFLIIYFIYEKLANNVPVRGFTTLAILLLFSIGLVLFSLSIIGEYIYRIFDESRKRPPYIISKNE